MLEIPHCLIFLNFFLVQTIHSLDIYIAIYTDKVVLLEQREKVAQVYAHGQNRELYSTITQCELLILGHHGGDCCNHSVALDPAWLFLQTENQMF